MHQIKTRTNFRNLSSLSSVHSRLFRPISRSPKDPAPTPESNTLLALTAHHARPRHAAATAARARPASLSPPAGSPQISPSLLFPFSLPSFFFSFLFPIFFLFSFLFSLLPSSFLSPFSYPARSTPPAPGHPCPRLPSRPRARRTGLPRRL